MNKLLSLDPATHYTGYALFEGQGDKFGITMYGLIHAPRMKGDDLGAMNMRTLEINSKLRAFIVNEKPTSLVLEYPEYQRGEKGYHAARQGDTLKLSYLCGKIVTGWELYVANVMARSKNKDLLPLPELVRPSQWKGQLTKAMTIKRCERRCGLIVGTGIDDNWVDAVMLGRWWLQQNSCSSFNADAVRYDL